MRTLFSVLAILLPAVPILAQATARVDRDGDALPNGAIARFGTSRLRHAGIGGEDSSFAFRPDSKAIASWNETTIRLWDLADGKRLWHFDAKSRIQAVAFAPDGKRLAVCCGIGVLLVDAATGKLDRTLKMSGAASAALSSDGQLVATAKRNPNGLVEVWAVATGNRIAELPIKDGKLQEVAFSANALTAAVTGAKNGSPIVWIVSWKVGAWERRPDFEPDVGISSYRLSDDGRLIGTRASAQWNIQVWNTETGKSTGEIKMGLSQFNFGAGGKTIVTSTPDRAEKTTKVALWDSTICEKLKEFVIPRHLGEEARLSPDSKHFATIVRGQMLCLWDAETGRRLLEGTGHDDQVTGLAFANGGEKLISFDRWKMQSWDTTKSVPVAAFPSVMRTFVLLPGGRELLADWGGIRRFDLATGKQIGDPFAPPKLPGMLPGDNFRTSSLRLSADCRTVVANGSLTGPQRKGASPYRVVWDVKTGKPTTEAVMPVIGSIDAMSADGRTVLSTTTTSRPTTDAASKYYFPTEYLTDADAVEVATGRKLVSFHLPEQYRYNNTFSTDGQTWAAITGRHGAVPAHPYANLDLRMWELRTGQERAVFPLKSPGHYDPHTFVFSPDGRLVAISRTHGRIEVVDIATGRDLAVFDGIEASSYKLVFRSDGRQLASGHTDGTILFWEIPAPPMKQSAATALELAWIDLASDDSSQAHRALWTLATSPSATTALLASRLKPADVTVLERIQTRLDDFDNDSFQVREAASRELAKLAEVIADSTFRDALRGNISAERQARIERLLALPAVVRSPELLRTLRAVEVLERIGTKEAAAVLRSLSGQPDKLRASKETKDVLDRLTARALPLKK